MHSGKQFSPHLIPLTYQITASLLQPFMGHYTDKRPMPYSLPVGMSFTLVGLVLLALAPTFHVLLIAAVFVGMGSAVFHPESSRVARMASGGQHGLAQSFFQVGGNTGGAIGPLLAAFIVLPQGQIGVLWFTLAAILGIVILIRVGAWYSHQHRTRNSRASAPSIATSTFPRSKIIVALAILGVLPFTLMLPYANLFWTGPLSVVIGFVLSSAFSAILVYGQELIPGRIGLISGLFFGFAFGMGGIGAAVLGRIADETSVVTVCKLCAWLPAIELLTAFLPNVEPHRTRKG